MSIKDLSKPTEIERNLRTLSLALNTLKGKLTVGSLNALVTDRERLQEIAAGVNNMDFCLAFNTLEETSRTALTDETLQSRVLDLRTRITATVAEIETAISAVVKSRLKNPNLEKAAQLCAKLYEGRAIDATWSAMQVGRKIEPVLHVRISNPVDRAQYEHASYNIWVKSGPGSTQVTTGFSSTPPSNGWMDCASDRALTEQIKRCLEQDGF